MAPYLEVTGDGLEIFQTVKPNELWVFYNSQFPSNTSQSFKGLRSRQNIYYLRNEKRIYKNCKGRRLSTIPLTRNIVLTLQGTHFPAKRLTVNQGETISLRNYITSNRAAVAIEGSALVIIAG